MVAHLCSRLNRCFYHLSVIFPLGCVYSLITWAWITFSGSICLYTIGGPGGAFLTIVSTTLYMMLFWSYTSACFTDPGSPSKLTEADNGSYSILPQHRVDAPLFTAVTTKNDGSERFCQKCSYKKPDRAHHCRSCRRCVLKMDHHCPWLAGCIGLYNYKQFLLFLIYVSTWCIFMCIVTAIFLWDFFTINRPDEVDAQFLPINWIILLVLSGIVGLVVGMFTAWHISLTLRNYTTIEYMEETRFKGDQKRYMTAQSPKDKFNIFDLGYKANWLQVMGPRPIHWFIPLRSATESDGFTFEISDKARQRLQEQQSLHSFERVHHDQYSIQHSQFELDDYRESGEYDRGRTH